jgi:hypothetical protein
LRKHVTLFGSEEVMPEVQLEKHLKRRCSNNVVQEKQFGMDEEFSTFSVVYHNVVDQGVKEELVWIEANSNMRIT